MNDKFNKKLVVESALPKQKKGNSGLVLFLLLLVLVASFAALEYLGYIDYLDFI